jgi:hypothetical protein
MNAIEKKLAEKNGVTTEVYGQTVDSLIRKRYSLWDELAILRQRDEKPEEYAAYNAYCEECKAKAKNILFGEIK